MVKGPKGNKKKEAQSIDMVVSILYPKSIFYKISESLKNTSKTYVLASGTFKEGFLAIFSYIVNLESPIFIGFRTMFKDF